MWTHNSAFSIFSRSGTYCFCYELSFKICSRKLFQTRIFKQVDSFISLIILYTFGFKINNSMNTLSLYSHYFLALESQPPMCGHHFWPKSLLELRSLSCTDCKHIEDWGLFKGPKQENLWAVSSFFWQFVTIQNAVPVQPPASVNSNSPTVSVTFSTTGKFYHVY